MKASLNAIVVCGPSGVGKGTLLKRLMTEYADRFAYSVSHTTRAPRLGEVNGREYNFVDRETVIAMREGGEFLELCEVHGNFYGTSFEAVRNVESTGKTCIIEIDVKGAVKVRGGQASSGLHPAFLFITAPIEDLRKRIIGRGADNEEVINRRLETAAKEYEFLKENPEFFDAVLVNDDLELAYKRLVVTLNSLFARHQMPLLAMEAPAIVPGEAINTAAVK